MSDDANPWQRLWAPLLSSRAGVWMAHNLAEPLDRLLLRVSHGRLSAAALIYSPLLLVTIGAKSGLRRETPLLYLRDGTRLVVIGTNFGKPNLPAWYHNLRANPTAEVLLNGTSARYRAYEASGDEYARFWQRGLRYYAGYAEYKKRTGGRPIPIMVLEPAED